MSSRNAPDAPPSRAREEGARLAPALAARAKERGDRLDVPRSGLSAPTRRIVFSLSEAILADEDRQGRILPARPELCERAVTAFDHAIGRGSLDLRRGIAILARVIEYLPLFIIGAPSRMSRLSIERRIVYLEALESHRIGLLCMLLVAFKIPLCIPAFEEGEELALTAFDRPSTVARRRLPTHMAEPQPNGSDGASEAAS